jgi:flagellar protein FlgJ
MIEATGAALPPVAPTASAGPPPIDRSSPLYKASQEFEAIFIKQMLNAMRKTTLSSGLLDGGLSQEVFEDMLYDEYAKNMSNSANFGLADTLYRALS